MITILIAIAAFIPVLGILVVVHELGHYWTAKAFGVKVLEFGFGYPPRLFGMRTGRTRVRSDADTLIYRYEEDTDHVEVGDFVKLSLIEDENKELVARTVIVYRSGVPKGKAANLVDPSREDDLKTEGIIKAIEGDTLVVADMLYSINLLPLGGFVRLAGENNPNVPRSLAGQGAGPRFVVLMAGAFMNAVLAIAMLTAVFMLPRDVTIGEVTITRTENGSPAAQAGILPGDVVTRVADHDIENRTDLARAVALNLGTTTQWHLARSGQEVIVELTPRFDPPEGQGAAGVAVQTRDPVVESRADPPWRALPESFVATGEMMVLVKNELSKWANGGDAPDLAGPVGIAQASGEVAQRGDIRLLLAFAGFLSMNLAIVNILPIPMLDGGRIVFVAIEWLRRGKRISPSREALVHVIGFSLLIGLILVITFGDLTRIAQGEKLLG
jgi:regulator of sigma E protease